MTLTTFDAGICIQVGRNLPHTNNTTGKDTISGTTATPAPLPAGGQAPALLEDRKAEHRSNIERFKDRFGSCRGRLTPGLTPAEFEKRKNDLRKTLLGSGTEKLEQLI